MWGGYSTTQPVLSAANYDKGGIQAMKQLNIERRGNCTDVVTETTPLSSTSRLSVRTTGNSYSGWDERLVILNH